MEGIFTSLSEEAASSRVAQVAIKMHHNQTLRNMVMPDGIAVLVVRDDETQSPIMAEIDRLGYREAWDAAHQVSSSAQQHVELFLEMVDEDRDHDDYDEPSYEEPASIEPNLFDYRPGPDPYANAYNHLYKDG